MNKINHNKAKTLRINPFGLDIFSFYKVEGLGFFRIFGIGLHWKDTTKHRLYFLERYGYSKAVNVGKWRISFLPK